MHVVLQVLQVVLRGTTSYCEILRLVLGGTMRYYELHRESLYGITRGLTYNNFFRGILTRVIFQKNCYEKFYKLHWKPTESLH